MGLQTFLFWTIASLTGLCAIAVVVTQNIVRAAAWLLFTLAGTAGIYFLIGADFVGGTQLIIYVGGILVLVVFGVMLTAQGPFITMKTGAAEWAVAMVVGILLFTVLASSIVLTPWSQSSEPHMNDAENSLSSVRLGEVFLGLEQVTPQRNLTGIGAHGEGTWGRRRVAYLLPFEIVSVHLLVVLIGAAYLARAKRRQGVPT
jgi:NADH-quinone oxidoreductase subunit J